MRAGVLLLSCLALTTNAWAQVRIADARVGLAAPSPGSLLVSADPSACLAPSTLNLAGVSPHGRDARGSRREPFSIDVWFENGFQGWSALLFSEGRELRGAPFGTHRIAIRRGVGVEEPIASVTISPDAPRAEAVLDVP